MSVFTLEALNAEEGDCLLLHWGERLVPHFLLIDGGPGNDTFLHRLRPRLDDLKQRFGAGGPLALPLVITSHIDDDHIGGVLALLQGLDRTQDDLVRIDCLWHNSFDALAGAQVSDDRLKQILADEPEIARYASSFDRELAGHDWLHRTEHLVIASVGQGRTLRAEADRLGIDVNCTFDDVVVAPAQGAARRQIAELGLTVIWPDQEHLDALRRSWRGATLAATRPDTSPTNLASIVVLAGFAGRRMLLTGDARGDHIVGGLERAGLMPRSGRINVDILKVPHHGSERNSDREFYERVWARHYVISANGHDDNPSRATLQNIVDVRGTAGYEVHLTNCGEAGTPMRQLVNDFQRRYPGNFRCRAPNDSSIRLALEDSID